MLKNGSYSLKTSGHIFPLMKRHSPRENSIRLSLTKKAKGKKGAIVGIFSGTKVEPIIEQLLKISAKERSKVREVTLDMANSMKIIVKKCFPKAIQVTDRFHVQKLALEAPSGYPDQTQMGGNRLRK